MFNVYRCVNDCDEVFRLHVAAFISHAKAQAWANAEQQRDVQGVFYTVEFA